MLTRRALNRSLLARQGLLARETSDVEAMVERLVALQAQEPQDPYVALWSRLADLDPLALSDRLADGRLVRAHVLRPTIHLVTARDYDALAPLNEGVMARSFRSSWSKRMGDVAVAPVVAAGRAQLADGPLSRAELDARLAPAFPGAERGALAMAATSHLPVAQVPPRGLWRTPGQARFGLREPAPSDVGAQEVVLRYLRGFGPATVADIRTWSGWTGVRDVVARLELVTVTDEDGRTLLDVPGAPYPDEDTPAPPRFLPAFDNVWLAHADRARIVSERVAPPGGTLLVDGFTAAGWTVHEGELHFDRPLPAEHREAVAAEGEELLAFLNRPAP